MDFNNVRLEIENRVGIVTINHPPANTLNAATLEGLSDCIDFASQNEEIKVLIITGEGKFFVAGADIKEFTGAFDDHEKAKSMAETGQRLFDKIENFAKPVIAAVNGAALGGGLELAMSCHIRIAAEDALLGLPELKLGLIPGFGGTQRLARITNKGKALELILTSQFIDGKEAAKIGLVNHALPMAEVMPKARQIAETIGLERGVPSIAAALRAVSAGLDMAMSEGQALEAELFGHVFTTEDVKEGVSAFIEKRKAQFKDK
jgi:enoyl-CoA hydratase